MRVLTANQRVASRYYPKGAMKIEVPEGLGTCYVAPWKGEEWQVIGYAGTAGNASFNIRFRNRSLAEKQVESFFLSLLAHEIRVAQSRSERSKPHTYKVGDVVYNSWGYDQTNVDFYQVTRATNNFVWLREISSALVPDKGVGPMSGKVIAKPGQFLDKAVEEKHKATGEYVSFKHGSGSKWDGKPKYCSWYA